MSQRNKQYEHISIKCEYKDNHKLIDIDGNVYFQVLDLEDELKFFNYCISNKIKIYKCNADSHLPRGTQYRFILTLATTFNFGKGGYYARKEHYTTFLQKG